MAEAATEDEDGGTTHSRVVQVRLSAAKFETWKRAAARSGRPLSHLVRTAVDEKIRIAVQKRSKS